MKEKYLSLNDGLKRLHLFELNQGLIFMFLVCMAPLLFGCGYIKIKNVLDGEKDSTFIHTLKETRINNGNYFISLPPDYSIKTTEGPDFMVYYFSPSDTSVKANYTGGMYFGGYPSRFGDDNDSCSKETVKNKILSKDVDWDVYTCNDTIFFIETIIEENEYEKIHAFGHARQKKSLFKLFDIYSTFIVKKY